MAEYDDHREYQELLVRCEQSESAMRNYKRDLAEVREALVLANKLGGAVSGSAKFWRLVDRALAREEEP